MSSRLRNVRAAGALAALLVAGASGTSTAAVANAGSSPVPLSETEPGSSAFSASDEATLAELQDLAGEQGQAEISTIVNSKKPADLLVDDNDQVIAAAYDTTESIGVRAISIRFPGCGVYDACAKSTSGVPNGFYGTGSLRVNLRSIAKISAGDRLTTFWTGGTGQFVNKYQDKYFTTARNFDKITRS